MAGRRNKLAPDDGAAPAPPGSGDGGDSGADAFGGKEGKDGPSTGSGRTGGATRIRVDPDPERDLPCCRLPLTDLGNAERWRIRHGQDFRFCAELGWFHWDGMRWKLLSEEKDQVPAEVIWSITLTVRAIRNEAALVAASGFPMPHGLSRKEEGEIEAWAEAHNVTSRELYLRGDEDGARAAWLEEREPMDLLLGRKQAALWSNKIAAWAKSSEQAASVGKIVKWVKGFADIVARTDEFDTDRNAINVLNGTLRLEKVTRKRPAEEIAAGKSTFHTVWGVKKYPHRREDLITKLAPVKYAPNAACPAYDAFLERVQPDPVMRRFIHQWGGLSLTGDISEHKLAFFYGGGRNGKGTWVEAVAHIAGDYAGSIGIESLLETGIKRRGDQATPDIAELPGVRFLRVSEPGKGMQWNDGLIKQMTGGDPIKARHLNKGFFQFFPSFKATVSGNNKPRVNDFSHGFWARMQLVPWSVTIPDEEIDHHLDEKLKAEASGIFTKLVEGLLDWRCNGLIVPDEVKAATRAYRDQSDDLGRFLSDVCEVGGDAREVRVGSQELFDLYTAWAEASGGGAWKIKGFKGAMEDRGFEQIQSNGMKWVKVRPKPGVSLEDVKAGRWPGAPAHAAASPAAPAGGEAPSAHSDMGGPSGSPGRGAGAGDDGPDGGAGDDWLPPEWEDE